nr:MAG TPA: TRYPTOPHAN RNA-BINDING ATTENUATOR PROTEIN-INHIBITORY PROTEIN REGULATION, ANTI-TRAP [Caudoviricetes sp.]
MQGDWLTLLHIILAGCVIGTGYIICHLVIDFVRCPNCNGKGFTDNGCCPFCEGTGKILKK